MSRRRFGAVRKLPSGRWQVRYRHPPADRYQTAPGTFATKTEAGRWLSVLEADMLRGDWLDPARATCASARSPNAGWPRRFTSATPPGLSTTRS